MTARDESALSLFQGGETADALLLHNEKTAEYGLTLTRAQAMTLSKTHRESLAQTGRVEFGRGVPDRLIDAFCDSPYMAREEYAETLCALIELFYALKNETEIGDDRLIALMRAAFDATRGAVEMMEDEIMRKAREARGWKVLEKGKAAV